MRAGAGDGGKAMRIAGAAVEGRRVAVAFEDGRRAALPFAWLRVACACGACRDPRNGQRTFDPADLPADLAPDSLAVEDGALAVRWAGDGHASRYAGSWLAANAPTPEGWQARRPRPRLWGRELERSLPRASWHEAVADPAAMYRWLGQVRDYGFAILSGVPCRDGEVERVADLFWRVHETNYGRHFDVVSRPDPNNLAYTAKALAGHTDNPYAEPVPGLQLLHCLEQSDAGGDNTLVDAHAAALRLRERDPGAFAVLTRVTARFRFADAAVDLRSRRPIIACEADGSIRAVHMNDRSFEDVDGTAAEAEAFFAAYRAFAALCRAPEAVVRVKLAAGDLLIMDNRRTLHGRASYEAGRGRRHLQGCYADAGGLASALRVLARRLGRDVVDAGLPGADGAEAVADEALAVLRARATEAYLGEPITQIAHALQAATLAEGQGAAPTVVAAALLHDIGHFLHELPEDAAERGLDSRHEAVGADWLAGRFGPAVAEPVRLHVDAKRFLVATEPTYAAMLSEASVLSLGLQGGPMSEAEAADFRDKPHAGTAVRIRRWDEAAKDTKAATPPLEHFRAHLVAAARDA